MNRRELVQRLVLDEISDDYENVDQCILRHVAEIGVTYGLTINRPEIVVALAELIDGGLAKAYFLPSTEPLQNMPPLDEVEEYFKTYFYITKKGMDLHLDGDTPLHLDDADKPL
ncbi:MAG: hypothetical protein ACRD4P_15735 [Bryobacteraceae bacterium]